MADSDSGRTMELKILSNVEEIGTHVFDNIPLSTTIGWLKAHLRDRLPSHPPAELQRFLYQGHFLENDNATLESIFGANPPEQQAFHLVLRPPRHHLGIHGHDSTPRTSSAPPDPARTHQPPPPRDAVRPTHAPHPPQPQAGVHVQQFQVPINAQQMNPQLNPQDMLQQMNQMMQFTMQNAAMAGGMFQGPQIPIPPGFTPMPAQRGATPQPAAPTPPTQNAQTHQPQVQAQGSVQQEGGRSATPQSHTHSSQHARAPQAAAGHHVQPHAQQFVHGPFIHPQQMLQIQPHQFRQVQPQQIQFQYPNPLLPPPPNMRYGYVPQPFAMAQPARPAATPQPPQQANPPNTDPQSFTSRMSEIQRELEGIQRRSQELSAQRFSAMEMMPSAMRHTEVRITARNLTEELRRMQSLLDALSSEQTDRAQPDFAPTRALVGDLLLQVQAMELVINRLQPPSGIVNLQPASTPIPQPTPTVTSSTTPSTNTSTSAAQPQNFMVLRNPNGEPHALLVGPSGAYRTPNIPQDVLNNIFSNAGRAGNQNNNPNDGITRFMRQTMGLAPPAQAPANQAPPQNNQHMLQALQQLIQNRLQARPQANAPQNAQQNPNQPPDPDHLGLNANANVANPQNANQNANAELRALLQPFLSLLWLVVRIAGMIYLFGGVGSGGNGWLHWRPLLIAGLMLIGFAMQQGVGRRRWEALRQHFEQLVGVQMQGIGPGQARQGQGQVEGQGGQAQAAQGADAQPGRQGQQGEVTVEQVAGNLVRQQQERGRGWLRERLRGVERAVALFMVSLWPGMGEGIVRAREQAEIRRIAQAEADERARAEETRRLEEEQQQGQPTEGVVAEAAGPGEGASTGAQVQEQAEQQDGEMRRVNKGKEKVEGEPSASTEAETSAPQERLLDLG